MRAFFVINSLADLGPEMTTTRLALAAAELGLETWVSPLSGLGFGPAARPVLDAFRLSPAGGSREARLERLRGASSVETSPGPADFVMPRINPARFGVAPEHELALLVLERLEALGARVVNSPRGLRRAASKALLPVVAEGLCPAQRTVSNLASALRAARELGPRVVVKPLSGSRGQGVRFVDVRRDGAASELESALASGPVVVQERVAGAERGDDRVVLVKGSPFELDGQMVAIHRQPAPGELRSNLHQGGSARAYAPSADKFEVLRRLGPRLVDLGLDLVGVDLLENRVIECNVYAPGGLGPFERLTGLDASIPIVETLARDSHSS